MSLFSLGLWGGLALGPVLGEAVLGDARYDAVWLTAAAFSLAAAFVAMTIPEARPAAGTGPAHPPRLLHPAATRPGPVLVPPVFGFGGVTTFFAFDARQL